MSSKPLLSYYYTVLLLLSTFSIDPPPFFSLPQHNNIFYVEAINSKHLREVQEEPHTEKRKSITLRAGVLHAPPFAIIEEKSTNQHGHNQTELTYNGFQPDMIRSLIEFAAQDNVDLNFKLSPAPPQYDPALDMVANDCNTTAQAHNYTIKQCNTYDIIIGDYYSTPERSVRVDFTPSWLRTTMSSMKYLDKKPGSKDYTTLTEASADGATVCVPDWTYLKEVVMNKFPDVEYLICSGPDVCLNELKSENCVLYVEDELQLRYRAAQDTSLEVTREQFNTQYLVWPMSYKLDPFVSSMMKKWIYAAVSNATADKLYYRYFAKELCPVGTAGEHCDLPCDPNHGMADLQGNCVCSSIRFTGDDCSVEVLENVHLIPFGLKTAGYTMFAVNVILCMGCAMWLFVRRSTIQVKLAQPFFLAMVLLGCLISTSTIVPLGQEDSGDGPVPSCMFIPWLYSVGFSITFGALFVKIQRVYKLFKAAINFQRKTVTLKETMFIIAGVLLLDIGVLLIWTIVDPLRWERVTLASDQFDFPLESQGFCYSDHWRIFGGMIAFLHFALMGTATYMCVVSRDLPEVFSGSKYISMAMVSNLQIFVVGVPVLILLGSDSDTNYFVRSLIIWMNDIVVVLLIFGDLIYSVEVKKVHESNACVNQVVGSAIKQYSANSQARKTGSASAINLVSAQGDCNSILNYSRAPGDETNSDHYYETPINPLPRVGSSKSLQEIFDHIEKGKLEKHQRSNKNSSNKSDTCHTSNNSSSTMAKKNVSFQENQLHVDDNTLPTVLADNISACGNGDEANCAGNPSTAAVSKKRLSSSSSSNMPKNFSGGSLSSQFILEHIKENGESQITFEGDEAIDDNDQGGISF